MSQKFNILLALFATTALFGHFRSGRSVTELWYMLDANSLIRLQAFMERRFDYNPGTPMLYSELMLPVLNYSLWGFVLQR